MTYKEICEKMTDAGWGSHAVLCLKEINDPAFDRQGTKFCTAGGIQRLDTYALYQQQGKAPDSSEWTGEASDFVFFEPAAGGSTIRRKFQAWIYRDKGLVGFINRQNNHMLCALSDVENRLKLKAGGTQ